MGYELQERCPEFTERLIPVRCGMILWLKSIRICSTGLGYASTVSAYNVDSRGEKTDQETGNKDLFSSVAEAAAMADTKKWKDEEARKQQEAQSQMNQAAQDAARQTQEQAAASCRHL